MQDRVTHPCCREIQRILSISLRETRSHCRESEVVKLSVWSSSTMPGLVRVLIYFFCRLATETPQFHLDTQLFSSWYKQRTLFNHGRSMKTNELFWPKYRSSFLTDHNKSSPHGESFIKIHQWYSWRARPEGILRQQRQQRWSYTKPLRYVAFIFAFKYNPMFDKYMSSWLEDSIAYKGCSLAFT